jgi:hypothetical protein
MEVTKVLATHVARLRMMIEKKDYASPQVANDIMKKILEELKG